MPKMVWKQLKPDDLEVVTDALAAMPDAERPLYGFTGVKTSLWSQIGGGAKPFVVLFTPDRIVFSKRSVTGTKEAERREFAHGDLTEVSVRNGPLLDSALFRFADGFKVRVGNIPHTQIDPVTRFRREGPGAFEWSRLSPVQKTNCYYTFTTMGVLPRDLL